MPQPKTFLLQVLVSLNPKLTYTIRSLYDGVILPNDPQYAFPVNVGDRVGWMVQGVIGGGYKLLPYNIAFKDKNTGAPDTSFFGVSSLSVPNGGPSPFLQVLSLEGRIKYNVDVPSLITIDPDIQSGGDTGKTGQHREVAPVSYVVSWDTSHPNDTMTYSADRGPSQPLPLPVLDGDNVAFNAVVQGGAAPTNFAIQFMPGNGWPSPFSSQYGGFSPTGGAPTTIGPLTVKDSEDPGASFAFSASITLNGHDVPPSSNPKNSITMSSSGKRPDARR